MQNARDYEIHIWYSADIGDECYIAQVMEWPTITAVGDKPEDAAREIQVALGLALLSARDAGIEPPAPARLAHA
jgi:predicted RNase H-like HicB family nuclease